MKELAAGVVLLSLLLGPSGPTSRVEVGPAGVELTLGKPRYPLGEEIEITLRLTGRGPHPAVFEFPTGQLYDFVVRQEDRIVWRWSDGRVFTQAFVKLVLEPGAVRTFRERWNQRDALGQQVRAGEYEMVAVFPPVGGPRLRHATDGPRVRFAVGCQQ